MSSFDEKLRLIELLVFDVDGTLTDGGTYYSDVGVALKRFNIRDGMGIVLLHKAGIKTAIITSEQTELVKKRAETLKIDKIIQGSRNKYASLSLLSNELDISLEQIAYIGDDVNDLHCLQKVGFSMAPSDAHDLIRNEVDYVSKYKGGNGAVRELCDLVLESKQMSITLPEDW
ncbi:MAG: KdsC family phosphatase [Ignavibacteria bacterium]|jgi:YrbI family 3-deoxy-D-manno-octulosonate 8-phosphate phosphatase